MGSLSIWHWIVVIAVVLLLFGRGKISDLMGDVAQGIKAFKKGMKDDDAALDKPPLDPVKSHRSQRRVIHACALGRRQQGRLKRDGFSKTRAAPNRFDASGQVASRERNLSCSISGGVNLSSSRLSR